MTIAIGPLGQLWKQRFFNRMKLSESKSLRIDAATIKAIESTLAKGNDAKVSNGPNGTIKVYSLETKLVLDTGKSK